MLHQLRFISAKYMYKGQFEYMHVTKGQGREVCEQIYLVYIDVHLQPLKGLITTPYK